MVFLWVWSVPHTVKVEGGKFINDNSVLQGIETDITHILLNMLSTKRKGRIDL